MLYNKRLQRTHIYQGYLEAISLNDVEKYG